MTDSIVTPENTKLIADWVGQEYEMIDGAVWAVIRTNKGKYRKHTEYNLLTNAHQSREVEKKLLDLGWEVRKRELVHFQRMIVLEAETLELTIYETALVELKNERT